MKTIAILTIAALSTPLYRHYVTTYWAELIRHTRQWWPNIDVYLLFEHATAIDGLDDLADHVIVDRCADLSQLCPVRYQTPIIPGVLSKTVDALELLDGRYDVFFRTNLSSVIKISVLNDFVQSSEDLCYSGGWVWTDSLRQALVTYGRIGCGKSIKWLTELDAYPGNTFVSGSGYFLNAQEASSLVERKHLLRYDIVDDVSVGLMFRQHRWLPGFSQVIRPGPSPEAIVQTIRATSACHIRLQHFPLALAQSLWPLLSNDGAGLG
jgi:hypothetical protein